MGAKIRDADDRARLSQRELDVLGWAARGKTNEEIAVILWVSRETVKSAVTSARWKLGALNRTHAVVLAIRARLIETEAYPD